MKNLFTRDSFVWSLTFYGGVALFIATQTDLLPAAWAGHVTQLAAVAAFIAGKLGNSPLSGA